MLGIATVLSIATSMILRNGAVSPMPNRFELTVLILLEWLSITGNEASVFYYLTQC